MSLDEAAGGGKAELGCGDNDEDELILLVVAAAAATRWNSRFMYCSTGEFMSSTGEEEEEDWAPPIKGSAQRQNRFKQLNN